ncbi:MAG TPA: hypothetical protein VIJ16_06280, partial [Gemmatimonadaceae bacterium]
MTGVRANGLRAAWWPVAAALALLAACQWLNVTSVEYLAGAALATAAAGAALHTLQRRVLLWAAVSTAMLALLVIFAGFTQWKLYRIDHDWRDIRSALSSDALAALDRRVDGAVADMRAAAARALEVPQDTTAAFQALASLVPHSADAGVVLYEQGAPLAWAGRVHASTDSLHDSIGVWRGGFYTS